MSFDRPDPAVAQAVVESSTLLPPEPYPGLRPFKPDEWPIFFGREPMIEEVVTRLLDRQFVVVHGSSGCGKSSLIRAGVLPRLDLEHARGGSVWKTELMRPEDRPLRNLCAALARRFGPPQPQSASQPQDAWHRLLVVGRAHDEIAARLVSGREKFCLLIDQFEELFRYAREGGREEAELFVEWICNHAERPASGLFVILTMRSDYIGMCAQFDRFAEQVDRCQYLLPRMDDLALLRAIREPARLFGGDLDRKVVHRLVSAARREEDSLPILQHTLMRACGEARKRGPSGPGWTVLPEDVTTVEGDHGALSTHAEEVLKRATGDDREKERIAEWVFRSLADVDGEGRIVRRPCKLDDLKDIARTSLQDVAGLIDVFRARDCSFLMPSLDDRRELTSDTMVDVGHEALLRQWILLSDTTVDPLTREPRGWLAREIEDGQRWRFLATQARAFKDDRAATLSPATTAAYERWWPAHDNPAWTARHARQRKEAAQEYAEVQELWKESTRSARRALALQAALHSLLPLLLTISLLSTGIWFGIKYLIDGGVGAAAGLFISVIFTHTSLRIREQRAKWWLAAGTFSGIIVGMLAGSIARGAFAAGAGAAAYTSFMFGFAAAQLTVRLLGIRAISKDRDPAGRSR